MASVTPAQFGSRLERRVKNVLRDFDELILAVHGKKRQASLEGMLAEQTLMTLSVVWESFLHDLLVAHVVRNSKSCVGHYEQRINQSIGDKFSGAVRWVKISIPARLNRAQVERLLDPKGWNVVATSADALKEMANKWLEASDAKKFSLNAEDAAFVDYLLAMRNYVAHRSAGSRIALLAAMKRILPGSTNGDLVGPAQQLGAYLRYRVGGHTRVNVIGDRILAISALIAT
jgi:hypothetical protein